MTYDNVVSMRTNDLTLGLFEYGLGELGSRGVDFDRGNNTDTLTVGRARTSMNGSVLGALGIETNTDDKNTRVFTEYDFNDYLSVKADVEKTLAGDYQGLRISRMYEPIDFDGREVLAKNIDDDVYVPACMSRAREDYVLSHEIAENRKMLRERKGRLSDSEHSDYEANILTALYELAADGNCRARMAYDEAVQMHEYRKGFGDAKEKKFSAEAMEAHKALLNKIWSYRN